ncbi:MAG: SAM-dependent chlorinase/fluorinase [Planctomycetota bacterium]
MTPIITFTSDFGHSDPYVAAVKGVMKSVAPTAEIIDITHEVPPGDVLAGGLALASAAFFFPVGTVHLAVVDPGVGTDRCIAAADLDGRFFVAPDNGLLCRAASRASERRFVYVENPRYWRPDPCPTFHGRDIMGPVAAHLAAGAALDLLGPPATALVPDAWEPPACLPGGLLQGKVVSIDRFANCITNISSGDLVRVKTVVTAGQSVPFVHTFADVPVGAPLAYFGSSGYLEVAVNRADASRTLGLRIGDPVSVS